MNAVEYYRGGSSLRPKRREVRIDSSTGLVLPVRGVSVFTRPDNLERFGGPHRVMNVPPELQIVQRGHDPTHFEIVPVRPMSFQDYEDTLGRIVLVPA